MIDGMRLAAGGAQAVEWDGGEPLLRAALDRHRPWDTWVQEAAAERRRRLEAGGLHGPWEGGRSRPSGTRRQGSAPPSVPVEEPAYTQQLESVDPGDPGDGFAGEPQ